MKPKVEKLEEDVGGLKESVNTTLNETEKLFQECNVELKRRVERLERYSRDFNIRVRGVAEEDGENCLTIMQDYFTLLGCQDDIGEIENVHRIGKKRDGKPRQIIAKLYSRPFKREFLRVAKAGDTPGDFVSRSPRSAYKIADIWHVRYRRLNSPAFAKCARSRCFLRLLL